MTVLGISNETLTAWSTFAAVVVALFGSVGVASWKRFRGPKFKITFGNEAPLMTIEPLATNPEWQYIRAKVENKGSRGARRVRAQITFVWFRNENEPIPKGGGWRELVQVPIPLSWTSRSFKEISNTEYTDLAPHMADYLTISRKYQIQTNKPYEHRLCGLGNEGNRENLMAQMDRIGEYRIEIAVFSDDTKPVTNVVSYEQYNSGLQLSNIQRSTRPPKYASPTPPVDLGALYKGN